MNFWLPVLKEVMEDKENFPYNGLARFCRNINAFLRKQDKHSMRMHYKWPKNRIWVDMDLTTFPRMVSLGYTFKNQITMSFGNIHM